MYLAKVYVNLWLQLYVYCKVSHHLYSSSTVVWAKPSCFYCLLSKLSGFSAETQKSRHSLWKDLDWTNYINKLSSLLVAAMAQLFGFSFCFSSSSPWKTPAIAVYRRWCPFALLPLSDRKLQFYKSSGSISLVQVLSNGLFIPTHSHTLSSKLQASVIILYSKWYIQYSTGDST